MFCVQTACRWHSGAARCRSDTDRKLRFVVAILLYSEHCASRKVAGSILDGVIGIFHSYNPSCRTMALGSTQPLKEIRMRNISWGLKTAVE
jgi:hypothetical protein